MNEHDPVQAAIDQSAVELLASNRRAAQQEVIDLAKHQHEQAALLDKGVTLVQQLGREALDLYTALETRESEIMRQASRLTVMDLLRTPIGWDRRYDVRSEQKIQRYTEAIVRQRDGDVSQAQAKRYARSELQRNAREDSQNKMLQRLGYTKAKSVISASGYEYYAPPVLKTDPETEDHIAQQWRVTAMLPCTWNKFSRLLQIRHEYKDADDLKVTTTHQIYLDQDEGIEELRVLGEKLDVDSPLAHQELFFPLGILIKSREAIMASTPKKW